MTRPLSEWRRCAHCQIRRATVHWSGYAKAWLCLGCYSKLPEAQYTGPSPRPYKEPTPPEPTDYAKFVTKVRDGLERATGHTVFYLGPGEMASFCPCCRKGTVSFTFVASPLRYIPHSVAGGVDHCSMGCSKEQIAAAL